MAAAYAHASSALRIAPMFGRRRESVCDSCIVGRLVNPDVIYSIQQRMPFTFLRVTVSLRVKECVYLRNPFSWERLTVNSPASTGKGSPTTELTLRKKTSIFYAARRLTYKLYCTIAHAFCTGKKMSIFIYTADFPYHRKYYRK